MQDYITNATNVEKNKLFIVFQNFTNSITELMRDNKSILCEDQFLTLRLPYLAMQE